MFAKTWWSYPRGNYQNWGQSWKLIYMYDEPLSRHKHVLHISLSPLLLFLNHHIFFFFLFLWLVVDPKLAFSFFHHTRRIFTFHSNKRNYFIRVFRSYTIFVSKASHTFKSYMYIRTILRGEKKNKKKSNDE